MGERRTMVNEVSRLGTIFDEQFRSLCDGLRGDCDLLARPLAAKSFPRQFHAFHHVICGGGVFRHLCGIWPGNSGNYSWTDRSGLLVCPSERVVPTFECALPCWNPYLFGGVRSDRDRRRNQPKVEG